MKKRLQIKKPIGKYRIGEFVQVHCDKNGVPISQYWRNRIKDSVIDHCVEEIQVEKQIAKKEENKKDKPSTKATI